MSKRDEPKPQKVKGRPIKETNWKLFEYLCSIQCRLYEIAGAMQCSEDTIQRHVLKKYGENYAVVYKQFSGNGLASLRRANWDEAVNKRNPTLLKHLSNNHLGMKEKVEMSGEIQTTGFTMDDVKKVMSDPIAKQLSLELAERMLVIENKEIKNENK